MKPASHDADTPESELEILWKHQNAELRSPHEVISHWQSAQDIDLEPLDWQVRGDWWDVLASTGSTLFITREYEHFVVALCVTNGKPRLSYVRLPHPSGLAVDQRSGRIYVACTRNPNVVFEFAPCSTLVPRDIRVPGEKFEEGVLLPAQSRFLPGCLYMHDLAFIRGRLYANAVALNAVVELPPTGGFRPVWWPECIDGPDGPRFGRNYLQLNSIAAGSTLERSFFSASASSPSNRRPGHLNFPVDRRGVIFSGATRAPLATGLTRPHSARLFEGELWVDNSGYGQVGQIVGGGFEPVANLPGWTRGLCHHEGVVFAGSSRVIPRFRHYAPGLDCDRSECAVHAFDRKTGRVLGSLVWPRGNQIFALELVSTSQTIGFPFTEKNRKSAERTHRLFFQGITTTP